MSNCIPQPLYFQSKIPQNALDGRLGGSQSPIDRMSTELECSMMRNLCSRIQKATHCIKQCIHFLTKWSISTEYRTKNNFSSKYS